MSLVIAPLTTTAMNSVSGRHSGLASGVNNAVSRTAGLLAIPVLGIFVFLVFSGGLDARVQNLDLPPKAQQQLEAEKVDLGGAEVPAGVSEETGDGDRTRHRRVVPRGLQAGDVHSRGPRPRERGRGGDHNRGQGHHSPDQEDGPTRRQNGTRMRRTSKRKSSSFSGHFGE